MSATNTGRKKLVVVCIALIIAGCILSTLIQAVGLHGSYFNSVFQFYDSDYHYYFEVINQQTQSPINVVFGLSGNHPGFLSEFEVALKSVLLNAPLDRNLSIHILADEGAFYSLQEIFNRTQLPTWKTRTAIELHAHDVTRFIPSLENQIKGTLAKGMGINEAGFRILFGGIYAHTIGAFFRLAADHFLPSTAAHVLYMDTDVVLMANLEELWKHVEREPDALIHWGLEMCSGFVVMNVPHMQDIWKLAADAPLKNISENFNQRPDDQLLFKAVNITHPERVHVLPDGWDMTVTEKWFKKFQPYDEKIPNVGMLHFNGGGNSKEAYFDDNKFMRRHTETWGNAKYYATLPWTWARYRAYSLVPSHSPGYLINITLCNRICYDQKHNNTFVYD